MRARGCAGLMTAGVTMLSLLGDGGAIAAPPTAAPTTEITGFSIRP